MDFPVPKGMNNASKAFYVCGFTQCKYYTATSKPYRSHINSVHQGATSYPCPHCSRWCENEKEFYTHLFGHVTFCVFCLYRCCGLNCRYGTNNLCAMRTHIHRMHSNLSSFTCKKCQATFVQVSTWLDHLRSSTLNVIQCAHCTVKSKDKKDVLMHIRIHHPSKYQKIIVSAQLLCNESRKVTSVNAELNPSTSVLDSEGSQSNTPSGSDTGDSTSSANFSVFNIINPSPETHLSSDKENDSTSQISKVEMWNKNRLNVASFTECDPFKERLDKTEFMLMGKIIKCANCQFIGYSYRDLNEHIMITHSNTLIKCKLCAFTRTTLKSVWEHTLLSHPWPGYCQYELIPPNSQTKNCNDNSSVPQSCTVGEKQATNSNDLIQVPNTKPKAPHNRSNSNTKTVDQKSLNVNKILCVRCGYICPKPKEMRTHLNCHLSYYPYQCGMCEKTYACKRSAHSHFLKAHLSDTFSFIHLLDEKIEEKVTELIRLGKEELLRKHTNVDPTTLAPLLPVNTETTSSTPGQPLLAQKSAIQKNSAEDSVTDKDLSGNLMPDKKNSGNVIIDKPSNIKTSSLCKKTTVSSALLAGKTSSNSDGKTSTKGNKKETDITTESSRHLKHASSFDKKRRVYLSPDKVFKQFKQRFSPYSLDKHPSHKKRHHINVEKVSKHKHKRRHSHSPKRHLKHVQSYLNHGSKKEPVDYAFRCPHCSYSHTWVSVFDHIRRRHEGRAPIPIANHIWHTEHKIKSARHLRYCCHMCLFISKRRRKFCRHLSAHWNHQRRSLNSQVEQVDSLENSVTLSESDSDDTSSSSKSKISIDLDPDVILNDICMSKKLFSL